MAEIIKGTILVVDDDDSFRSSFQDILEESQFRCISVASGREALDVLKKQAVDLVLLDIQMPEMDGIECLREIRRVHPTVRVMMVTAYSERIDKAREIGALDILSKPLAIDNLIPVLEKRVKRPVVVVLEDDPDFFRDLQQGLRDRGLSLCLVLDRDEAMEAAYKQIPDVMILNLDLKSGESKARSIKKLRKDMPMFPLIALVNSEREKVEIEWHGVPEKVVTFYTRPVPTENIIRMLLDMAKGQFN